MREQINLVISEELLKCSTDEASFNRIKKYYHKGREQKRAYVVAGRVQDAATHFLPAALSLLLPSSPPNRASLVIGGNTSRVVGRSCE